MQRGYSLNDKHIKKNINTKVVFDEYVSNIFDDCHVDFITWSLVLFQTAP